MGGLQELINALSNGTIPDPLPRSPTSPSSRLGVCKLATPLISGTGKATDFKFGGYIYRAKPNKSPLKISEKRERGRIQGCPTFLGTPYYLRNGQSYGLQILQEHSQGRSIGTNAHEKCWEQQPWAQSGSPENIQGTYVHVQGTWSNCAVIFAIAQLSC